MTWENEWSLTQQTVTTNILFISTSTTALTNKLTNQTNDFSVICVKAKGLFPPKTLYHCVNMTHCQQLTWCGRWECPSWPSGPWSEGTGRYHWSWTHGPSAFVSAWKAGLIGGCWGCSHHYRGPSAKQTAHQHLSEQSEQASKQQEQEDKYRNSLLANICANTSHHQSGRKMGILSKWLGSMTKMAKY